MDNHDDIFIANVCNKKTKNQSFPFGCTSRSVKVSVHPACFLYYHIPILCGLSRGVKPRPIRFAKAGV